MAPLCAPRPPRPIIILLIAAIVLAIATVFGNVIGLKICEFGDFNNVFNGLNNEGELERSGLNNIECDLCGALSPRGLHVNNVIGIELIGAGPAPAVATTTTTVITNKNENNFYCDCNGDFNYPNTGSPPTTPEPALNFGALDIGLVENNINGYVFGEVLNENEFYCDVNDIFEYNFNENLWCNGDFNAFDNAFSGMFIFDFFENFFFAGYVTILVTFPRRVMF